MRPFLSIAWNGFREARRNRVTLVVALFAAVLLMSSSLVTEVTIATFRRVVTDFGLGAMTLMLVALAIFLSTAQLTREIERRTIFLVVTKPISRTAFVLGRICGTMLTLTVLQAIMVATFLLELKLLGVPISEAQLQGAGMLVFELLVVTCIGTLLATFAEQLTSAMVTASAFLAGHLSSDVYNLAIKSKSAGIRVTGQLAYWLVPNLSRLSFRGQASAENPASWSELTSAAGYALVWAGLLVAIAVAVFQRRDFK